ncbi:MULTISPECIES: hypothetical protein [unclassified Paenibacillus]|uniref:SF0329 family protein n=1 Tax=unclassified Paenibacillus TaxID=185978 RepID=UPI0003E21A58|nr:MULTISPECIES: hypothetical protein [unclassified Paenibacillus]ETT53087.1 hypothetical protein C162_07529 [Paenibacillus sp. FSL R7-269]OMF92560.1 hypothetical protein BK147_19855 [Paenibacillus sp. FSL R7-0337]
MSWSKLKQQLEGFLSPSLEGRVEYRAPAYRYSPDKSGTCYITVDKKNILSMTDKSSSIRWYSSELEVKNDPELHISVTNEDIEAVRLTAKGPIPEDRLIIMARSRLTTEHAKALMLAQAALTKSNFIVVANKFLVTPIEESLESSDIILNILALMDRRVGRKRIEGMAVKMQRKHPAVEYFYDLRRGAR